MACCLASWYGDEQKIREPGSPDIIEGLLSYGGLWSGAVHRQNVTLVGWLITEKISETKRGEPMEFLTFEDQMAMHDATLFPDAYPVLPSPGFQSGVCGPRSRGGELWDYHTYNCSPRIDRPQVTMKADEFPSLGKPDDLLDRPAVMAIGPLERWHVNITRKTLIGPDLRLIQRSSAK